MAGKFRREEVVVNGHRATIKVAEGRPEPEPVDPGRLVYLGRHELRYPRLGTQAPYIREVDAHVDIDNPLKKYVRHPGGSIFEPLFASEPDPPGEPFMIRTDIRFASNFSTAEEPPPPTEQEPPPPHVQDVLRYIFRR